MSEKIREIRELEELISNFQRLIGYDEIFTQGQCQPFAIALCDMLGKGAKLYTYGHVHYFVKYGRVYIDANGVYQSKKELKLNNDYPLKENKDWFWKELSRRDVFFSSSGITTSERTVKNVRKLLEDANLGVKTTSQEVIQF